MGDRGNLRLIGRDGEVWFYSHWRGHEIPAAVANGLRAGKDRWGDEPYLNRILFDSFTGGQKGTTGFGISAGIGDNDGERPVVVVHHDTQLVFLQSPDDAAAKLPPSGTGFAFSDVAGSADPATLLGWPG